MIVLRGAVAPSRGAGLDLTGIGTDREVRDDVVAGLAGAVADDCGE
ncbi:uncharacterized protein METZ01_LOCUS294589, partial [marine metagenome]